MFQVTFILSMFKSTIGSLENTKIEAVAGKDSTDKPRGLKAVVGVHAEFSPSFSKTGFV
jgi:hypothetical protein